MADQHCRVTIAGDRKRVDLAVPSRAPIAEYVTTLADLCGQEDSDAMPAAWTLAPLSGPHRLGQPAAGRRLGASLA